MSPNQGSRTDPPNRKHAPQTDAPQQGVGIVQPSALSLPKGGGAIKGIGEKFAANPVTGTGSMTVPIATSPGRSGFGPQLSLSYDSGSGNSPFGFGWSLALASITRKTDKGLPQYCDAEESDVFLLSGAEDLVPEFKKDRDGNWVLEDGKHVLFDEPVTVDGVVYSVRRYRTRVEGLFARIERWTNCTNGETHWRSITKDNITTLYGKDNDSRIFDRAQRAPDPEPAHPMRIFSWLICQSYDDKGNAIVYKYVAENDQDVDHTQANERNRVRTANRYLKRIQYGNRTPNRDARGQVIDQASLPADTWMFEVVFDYGEHNQATPMPNEPGVWPCRQDPFSSYRAGFEIRTYRLCQRALMFHHFPGEEGVGNNCLVRSTDFTYAYEQSPDTLHNPIFSYLLSVTQSGYKRQASGYLTKALPPVEFTYSQATIQSEVREVEGLSLENLPIGLDGTAYQWTDLHGEGLPGILTEQGGTWFYKRNISPISNQPGNGMARIAAKFAPVELVAVKPNLSLAGGQAQFMDLAGDGRLDLVVWDGPTPGFYEHDGAEGWEPFRPFSARLNRDLHDPNLKFVDLNGDGYADILICEDDAFTWHPSLAEQGFGGARRVQQAPDEESGPRLVFADGSQSIYLADMSGDGLTDLVRLRNGEVCYWPSLGYGRFGAKVTMGGSPWFDQSDQFDQKRIRLADIDGSGATDIIYLHREGVRLYFNQSGNRWGAPQTLRIFPRVNDLVSIMPLDLFGNGTACLVWSSPLPGDASHPMRYVDLMGGQKPHLLVKIVNNLGAETHIAYAPSTKFYLEDKYAGKPWITKLPFPVHCVEKMTVTDKWRQTAFTTTYSYHHGYFDGDEREFRGFGRVEQVDVENYGAFTQGNRASPYITDDQTLYQPPIKTITWFHTGAFLDREQILSQFQQEYFAPRSAHFQENDLPEPDLASLGLSTDEWREALRACKGMTLRQEVYELDVDTLAHGEERRIRLFSTAFHNCHIQRLQPRATNRHAVFFVTESEAITYHYELDLRSVTLTPDPRIAHTLNLKIDELGNVQQTVVAVYPRIDRHTDPSLPAGAEALINGVQAEMHLAYTETRYTNDVIDSDNYRLRVPCEVLTYELTDIVPVRLPYFTLADLRHYRLSEVHQAIGMPVTEIAYHVIANHTTPPTPQKRCVEHVRMLFFRDNPSEPLALQASLALGQLGRLGLPYETYKLTLTDDLLTAILGEKLSALQNPTESRAAMLDRVLGTGGYHHFAEAANRWWIRSGIAGFADDAAQHFYLPERYTDPFGNVTTLAYDSRDLFIQSSSDPLGNRSEVTHFDFRVLAPQAMRDPNDNLSEVGFDVLGMPAAMAVKGKGGEGDTLAGVPIDLTTDALVDFFSNDYTEVEAQRLLSNATARHLYHFGERLNADGSISWGIDPACACTILRERHVATLGDRGQSPLQVGFAYSDGGGNVLVTKQQAEPATVDGPLRWIANGKTVLNNKGKPVKQYEPYFSPPAVAQHFAEPREEGVTPIIYYDAAGRTVRTEMPDGSYSRVEFSPWQVATYDANDTVLEESNAWYARHTGPTASTEEQRAAQLATKFAATPALTLLDSLGRDVVAIAHNRTPSSAPEWTNTPLLDRPWLAEKQLTFTKLDAEGKALWIRDARRNLVMQYIMPPVINNQLADPTSGFAPCYDIAGNLLFQHSMDGGDRWLLHDAAGKPMLAWDLNERQTADGPITEQRYFFTAYDALHRPTAHWLTINGGAPQMIERFHYGEALAGDEAKRRNLRGQLHEHYDMSGRMVNVRYDFQGNLLEAERTLASAYDAPVIDWSDSSPTAGLEAERWTQITEYDALNRMTRQYNWHHGVDSRVTVYEPRYNERGLLVGEDLVLHATKTDDGYREEPRPAPERPAQRTTPIRAMQYDAKGQKTLLHHGNGTLTRYSYDPQTFRLQQLRTTRPDYNPPFPAYRSGLGDNNVLQQLSYTYDPVGNITEIYDEAYAPVYFQNQLVEPHSQYTYDALYRLIEATGRENATATGSPPQRQNTADHIGELPIPGPDALRNYTERYVYDSVGNILQMQHSAGSPGSWTRRYSYATDSNRLLRTWEGAANWDDAATTNQVSYAYDTYGNMLNLNRVPEEYRLRWDYRDMIHVANLGGGGWAYYTYDAGKERTRKVITNREGNKQWERLYLGGMEVYRRYRGTEMVEEIETHHLFVGEQRVLLIEDVLDTDNERLARGPLFRYQLTNHLGSSCVELNADATIIISYEEYHPYGTIAYHAANPTIRATAKRYRYTGKERDEETGLNYHSSRYYAPWVGRWMSADSAGVMDGTNLYQYVSANPATKTDPSGRQGVTAEQYRRLQQLYRTGQVSGGEAGGGRDPNLAPPPTQEQLRVREALRRSRTPHSVPSADDLAVRAVARIVRDEVRSSISSMTENVHPGITAPHRRGVPDFAPGTLTHRPISSEMGLAVLGHSDLRIGRQTNEATERMMFWVRQLVEVVNAAQLAANNAAFGRVASLSATRLTQRFAGTSLTEGALTERALAGARNVNTGSGLTSTGHPVAQMNCGYVTTADLSAAPEFSTGVAIDAGMTEGVVDFGPPGGTLGDLLQRTGLSGGVPEFGNGTAQAARQFMSLFPVGSRFAVAYARGPGQIGHVVSATRGRLGVLFRDRQPQGFWRQLPFFRLESGATNVNVYVTYLAGQ